jgi:uncharacterized membrane-anchored protein YjiN (DUF445 family)
MSEQRQLAQLNKTRAIATGLLLAMAVLFLGVRLLQPAHPWMSFVSAFAEAAMVGALADWFAVTALFRHPLGLPIPHTAIIPRNKDRIGESIGNFLEENFMTHDVLREELAHIDFAGAAAGWLGEPRNSRAVAAEAVAMVPMLLRMIEDDDVGRFMQQVMAHSTRQTRFGPMAAEVLAILVAGNRHQVLFDRMIELAADALERNKPFIRQKVHERSPRWMPKAFDERFFERLVDGVQTTLDEMRDENSEWRDNFRAMIDELIENLKVSPEYEEKVAHAIGQGLGHPLLRNYLNQVWQELRARLLADAMSPDSALVARLDSALHSFSTTLNGDPAVRDKLNEWARNFAAEAISGRRHAIADLVKRVIRKWDAETVSHKLELHVGRDLQYIRINGTLVGGCVGVVLHALTLVL